MGTKLVYMGNIQGLLTFGAVWRGDELGYSEVFVGELKLRV